MTLIKFTIFAATAYLFSSCNPNKRDVTQSAGFIPVDSANVMIGSYLESISGDSTSTRDTTHLNSLIMDADDLRSYLNDNPEIDKVKIMFAHTLDYINAGNRGQYAGYKSGALTVVIAGYDKNENYIFTPDNKVPNHCTPCPDFCPKKGTAAYNLLQ